MTTTEMMAPPRSAEERRIRRAYGGRDPLALPAYTVPDVALATGFSPATLRRYLSSSEHRSPIIRAADPEAKLLSYTNLVEAHVLAGLRKVDQIPLHNIRAAVLYVEKKLGVKHPLAQKIFSTKGVNLLVEFYAELIEANREGQLVMREALLERVHKVEYGPGGLPKRVRPIYRHEPDVRPDLVSIAPLVAFGRPVITGTRIPTLIVAGRYKAGDSIKELALDYERSPEEIRAALIYERAA